MPKFEIQQISPSLINNYRKQVKKQIIKLCVFIIITVFIASLLTSQQTMEGYSVALTHNKIINKRMRGVFPPLNGDATSFVGKWKPKIYISENIVDTRTFQNYTLQFRKNNKVLIKHERQNCNPHQQFYEFEWRNFSYNIFISDGIKYQPDSLIDNNQNANISQSQSQNITDLNKEANNSILKHEDVQSSFNQSSSRRNLELLGSNNSHQSQQLPQQYGDSDTKSLETQNAEYQKKDQNYEKTQQSNIVASGGLEKDDQKQVVVWERCFEQEDKLISLIDTLTIWTFKSHNLYILSEIGNQERKLTAFFVFFKI